MQKIGQHINYVESFLHITFYNVNLSTCLLFIVLRLLRGQSPMHVLGHYGKENAAAIFELFLECMPEYPLDKPDNEGNTGTVACLIIVIVNSIQIAK